MGDFFEEKINKSTDWGGDSSTGGLPVLGGRVQDFIKEQLEARGGVAYYEESTNRFLVFSDDENKNRYISNPQDDLVLFAINLSSGFYECTTAENTSAKVISVNHFQLTKAIRIIVKMTNRNSASSVTLNIGNTGAKPLYYKGQRASSTNTWVAGAVLDLYYNGTNFMAVDYGNALPEAPADGSTYGRKNKGWVKTIGRSGTGSSAETFNNTSNTASGNYSHAEGDATNASGHAAHAEGQKTKATGYASHAEGGSTEPAYQTHAAGKFAHAEGNRTSAAKDASHSEGYATTANGTCSHAEGNKTTATGEDSHAEGNTTNALGLYSHAEGHNTNAKGQAAHAEGNGTKTGECSTYDSNYDTISTSGNNYGHAEGNNTAAGGMSSHAEGEGSNAFGRASHSEGQSGAAIGLASHSEGELTMACGEGSHSEGIYTQAGKAVKNGDGVTSSGSAAHAEGCTTKALGDNSHAEGKNTIANNESEHSQGRFNLSHTHASDTSQQTIDSVGIGTKESDRKNATETMVNGDLYIYGIGGYNGQNPSEAQTLQQVAANIPIILDDFYDIVRQLTGGSNVLKGSYAAPTVKPSELHSRIVFGRLKDSEGVYGATPLAVRKDYGDRGDLYWFTFFMEGIYGVFAMNVDADDTWGDILTSNFKHKNIFE